MKTLSICFGAFLVVAAVGCTKRSAPGGGADKATKFDLAGPATSTSIKQGETQTVAVKVERGKEFKQAVALKVEPPAGVDAELSAASNKASDKGDVNLKITATDKATLGEHIVYVTGTPDTGNATKLEVKIKVLAAPEANKDATKLSLHGPLLSTTIKQGETKTINVSLKQSGGKYVGNVKLGIENPPKGVTTEFTSKTIKSTDSGDVGLKITADKTAALGEHTLHITGTADTGTMTVTPVDVKLKVEAP